MELKRQIQFDKKCYAELGTAIKETTDKFNETLELIRELTARLVVLGEDKKGYEVRIKLRELELDELSNI